MTSEHEPPLTALQARWAALPDWLRGGKMGKWVNPQNLTRIHLAHLIQRHGYHIGGHSYGRPKLRFPGGTARLQIGRFCSIADGVEIMLGGNHRMDWITTYPFPEFGSTWSLASPRNDHQTTRGDVTIGHDVWLGSQCMILSGVSIGHGAVVGARAVVTRNVPPYAIVAGNPARIIRMRFDEAQVTAVLKMAWWDWPREKIEANLPLLMSGDATALAHKS
jgi:virginiamycin A acetyltransferase